MHNITALPTDQLLILIVSLCLLRRFIPKQNAKRNPTVKFPLACHLANQYQQSSTITFYPSPQNGQVLARSYHRLHICEIGISLWRLIVYLQNSFGKTNKKYIFICSIVHDPDSWKRSRRQQVIGSHGVDQILEEYSATAVERLTSSRQTNLHSDSNLDMYMQLSCPIYDIIWLELKVPILLRHDHWGYGWVLWKINCIPITFHRTQSYPLWWCFSIRSKFWVQQIFYSYFQHRSQFSPTIFPHKRFVYTHAELVYCILFSCCF